VVQFPEMPEGTGCLCLLQGSSARADELGLFRAGFAREEQLALQQDAFRALFAFRKDWRVFERTSCHARGCHPDVLVLAGGSKKFVFESGWIISRCCRQYADWGRSIRSGTFRPHRPCRIAGAFPPALVLTPSELPCPEQDGVQDRPIAHVRLPSHASPVRAPPPPRRLNC